MERSRYGTSRIARGSDQDIDRWPSGRAQPREACREKTRAEILERGSRTVKQLEYRIAPIRAEGRNWCRKAVRLLHDRIELRGQRIASDEGRNQARCKLGQRIGQRRKRLRVQCRPGIRYVKTTVWRESATHCGAETDRLTTARAAIVHGRRGNITRSRARRPTGRAPPSNRSRRRA